MKQIILSMSLLLSYSVAKGMDLTEKNLPFAARKAAIIQQEEQNKTDFVKILQKDDNSGDTMLHKSVKSYNNDQLIAGLKNITEENIDQKIDLLQKTIIETISNLREIGVDVNAQNSKGKTALYLAVKRDALNCSGSDLI